MAPNSRLEEKLRKLGLQNEDTPASRSSPVCKSKDFFRMYFPMPPYTGLHFSALRSGSGYNFTGQLLGVGGKQLQRIKQESSARVEVVNAQGNLNGAHPDPLDPGLHALITADSLSKLQKAAEMVRELLQPLNGRYQPIDVTPGGSARLTVVQQGRPASRSIGSTTPSPAVTPTTAEKLKACSGSKAADVVGRSGSASPALIPRTPAATANNQHTFASSVSSGCSRRSCSPQPCNADETSSSSITCLSGDRSNEQVAVFGSPRDSTATAPATVQTSSAVARRVSFGSTPGPLENRASSNGSGEGITGTGGSPGPLYIAHSSWSSRVADKQTPRTAAGHSHAACDLEPATPSAQQTQSAGDTAAVVASVLPATPEAGSTAPIDLSRPSEQSSTGNVSLPSSLMQDLGIAADETYSRTAHNSSAGVFPARKGDQIDVQDHEPLAKLRTEPLGQPGSASSGLGVASGSCFQYGLGLCNSSSWDSPLSCSGKDSPALQALVADHQRQQQQWADQMQQQFQNIAHGGPFTPPPFNNGNIMCSRFAVGSLPNDGFYLGPAALGPAVDSNTAASRYDVAGDRQQGYQSVAYEHAPGTTSSWGLQHPTAGLPGPPGPCGPPGAVVTDDWSLGLQTSVATPYATGVVYPNPGFGPEPDLTGDFPYGLQGNNGAGWLASQQCLQTPQTPVFMQNQQHGLGPWQEAGSAIVGPAYGCGDYPSCSYDPAHTLSSSIW